MSKPKDIMAIRLLPNKCKTWGLMILSVSLLPAIIIHARGIHLSPAGNETLKAISFAIFAIGLSLIAWAKDKVEDELTMLLRLKAMGFAFGYGVFYATFQPFAYALFAGSVAGLSAYELVTTMLLAYLFIYYGQKWRR